MKVVTLDLLKEVQNYAEFRLRYMKDILGIIRQLKNKRL